MGKLNMTQIIKGQLFLGIFLDNKSLPVITFWFKCFIDSLRRLFINQRLPLLPWARNFTLIA